VNCGAPRIQQVKHSVYLRICKLLFMGCTPQGLSKHARRSMLCIGASNKSENGEPVTNWVSSSKRFVHRRKPLGGITCQLVSQMGWFQEANPWTPGRTSETERHVIAKRTCKLLWSRPSLPSSSPNTSDPRIQKENPWTDRGYPSTINRKPILRTVINGCSKFCPAQR
jgi:hypothetical protein